MIPNSESADSARPAPDILDVCGLSCPLPILKTKRALAALPPGALLQILATDPHAPEDLAVFCRQTGHVLLESGKQAEKFVCLVQRKS
ncbi:MAG: sulfurtransferase TusA family protein [Zoogloeaceae bacterium]|jgi:tRNA 2-thiouridine synthesizing protein A|nr:sulfurtransferase TusA family protein [Zoogloeaceae bacterium]